MSRKTKTKPTPNDPTETDSQTGLFNQARSAASNAAYLADTTKDAIVRAVWLVHEGERILPGDVSTLVDLSKRLVEEAAKVSKATEALAAWVASQP
jgi:uncharacterized protein YbcV (DUF1398 family)